MEKKQKATKIFLYVLLIALTVFMLVPFYWMVISSLKENKDVFSVPMQWWPQVMHWENYQRIWEKIPLLTYFKNTAKLTIITTIIQLCTSCFAAYGFTKCRFKGRDTIFLMYVTTIAVPWQVYMIPQFVLISKIGLNDTHLGLILMQSFSAFGVFLMRQFIASLPDELEEAAIIDGAGVPQIFFRIVLPLVKPSLAAFGIFVFLGQWNNFMNPLIFLNKTETFTVPLMLNFFKGTYATDYPLLMAGTVISILPVLVVYMFFQKQIIQGIAITGMKN